MSSPGGPDGAYAIRRVTFLEGFAYWCGPAEITTIIYEINISIAWTNNWTIDAELATRLPAEDAVVVMLQLSSELVNRFHITAVEVMSRDQAIEVRP